ncbi:MAG: mandelate racemase/muconate lactonizing enzyme family protein [Bacteroidales bacterium]|nr:mandelate racemase/muconate lactonizing enzyme family protein [Bacteroidales bacterium]
MKTSRRDFLIKSARASVTGLVAPSLLNACKNETMPDSGDLRTPIPYQDSDFNPLSNIETLIPSSQIITDIKIWNIGGEFIIETIAGGISGYAYSNNRLPDTLSLFKNLVFPFFIGKDARNIYKLVDAFYRHDKNYKYASLILWNCFAHVEVGILDILGKITSKPVNQLLGNIRKNAIDVYLSSSRRDTTPEEEYEWLSKRISETGCSALKLKIGGRMSNNSDAFQGRTDNLVPLFRRNLGDDYTIYADANGSYDVKKAIEIGKWLKEYNVGFYEEPCEWEDFESTKKISDALNIDVAGGEQDSSLPKIKWMLENRAVDIIQPDIMYCGGILRTMNIAKMAADCGIQIVPHCPRNNPALNHMLQVMSVVPNAGQYHEFNAKKPEIKVEYEPLLLAKQGKVALPTGPGLGITYNPDTWEKGEIILQS